MWVVVERRLGVCVAGSSNRARVGHANRDENQVREHENECSIELGAATVAGDREEERDCHRRQRKAARLNGALGGGRPDNDEVVTTIGVYAIRTYILRPLGTPSC
jgi:hypothetical protein